MSKPNLSKEQLLAINHFEGPALVVAGPGSGKTTVIVNRINNLIYQKHIKPDNILVITFSKTAATSMQQRFINDNSNLPVYFGTFHSLFYNIVKQQIGYLKVATTKNKRKFLIQVLKNISYSDNIEPDFLDLIIKRISFYKNSGLKHDNKDICDIDDKIFNTIINDYNHILKCHNYIDFDDMMLLCKKLLVENVKLREKYQELFKFILIDEFQDINDLQFEIVQLLSKNNNIFAVGDDDQSIYGFRGSNPKIMQEFNMYYPDTKRIYLSCNYRSAGNIVKMASDLIKCNQNRINKNITTINDIGEGVALDKYNSYSEELLSICRLVKNKKKCTGILFRNNTGVSEMVNVLIKENIKFEVVEKINNPFDSIVVSDFIHYINMSQNIEQMDMSDFIPVMNKPVRYISREYLKNKYVDLTYLCGMYKDKQYISKKIYDLKRDLTIIANMDLFSAFNYIWNVIGYKEYVEKQENEKKRNELKEQYDFIRNMVKELKNINELMYYIENYEEASSAKNNVEIKENGIYVMTYHASKGLEFDEVFVPNLMEGVCPSSKSIDSDAIEEERRMLYVAMTRAKYNLYLSFTENEHEKKSIRSRFLYDIMKSE